MNSNHLKTPNQNDGIITATKHLKEALKERAQRSQIQEPAESLDLEQVTNPYLFQQYYSTFPHNKAGIVFLYFVDFIFGILIAIMVACLVKLCVWAGEVLFEIRIEYAVEWMTYGLDLRPESTQIQAGVLWGQAWLVCVGLSIAIVVIPALLISSLYTASSGPGIPELIAFLNGTYMEKYYELTTLIVKTIGLIAIVGAGLFSGIDGPLGHMGSIMAIQMSKYLSPLVVKIRRLIGKDSKDKTMENHSNVEKPDERLAHLDDGYMTRVDRARYMVNIASLGAAAGVSSAFRSPLGGVSFVLEEAITHFAPSIVIRTLFVTTVAYIFSIWINLAGSDVGLGYREYGLWVTNATCNLKSSFWSILYGILMGIFFGIFGHLYNLAVIFIKQTRHHFTIRNKISSRIWRQLLDLLIVILITTTIVLFVPVSPWFKNCTMRRFAIEPVLLGPEGQECNLMCIEGEVDIKGNCPFQLKLGVKAKHLPVQSTICLPDETSELLTVYLYTGLMEYQDNCTMNPNSTENWNMFDKVQNPGLIEEVFFSWSANHLRWITMEELTKMGNWTFHRKSDVPNGQDLNVCYNQMQSLLWNSPEFILQNLLLRGLYYLFTPGVLATFTVIYLFLSMLLYGICLPTDLVIPNLIVGASLGRLIGLGINVMNSMLSMDPLLVDPGAYAMLGMAGLWAGVSRLPLTVILVMIEGTADLNYLPTVCIVVVFSAMTGNLFGPSLYHQEIERRRMLYLVPEPHDMHSLESIFVKDVMSKDLIVVPAIATRKRIWQILTSCEHHGFPVVIKRNQEGYNGDTMEDQLKSMNSMLNTIPPDDVPIMLKGDKSDYICIGLVLRSALETQLSKGSDTYVESLGQTIKRRRRIARSSFIVSNETVDDGDVEMQENGTASGTTQRNYLDTNSRTIDSRDSEVVNAIQDNSPISLLPLMNCSPTTCSSQITVAKAYNLFRDLQLRHLIVTNGIGYGGIVGIVTRKDLIDEVELVEHHNHNVEMFD